MFKIIMAPVFIGSLYLGMLFTLMTVGHVFSDDARLDDSIFLIVVSSIFFFIAVKIAAIYSKYRCAYCGSYKTLIEKEGESLWRWKYALMDGSKDSRYTDNIQITNKISCMRCHKCHALTQYFHKASKNPSRNRKIVRYALVEGGEGKRKIWGGT